MTDLQDKREYPNIIAIDSYWVKIPPNIRFIITILFIIITGLSLGFFISYLLDGGTDQRYYLFMVTSDNHVLRMDNLKSNQYNLKFFEVFYNATLIYRKHDHVYCFSKHKKASSNITSRFNCTPTKIMI